jgi:16S rRNA processing protein RimM
MKVFPELASIGYIQKTFGFNGQVSLNLDAEILDAKNFPKFLWFMRFGKPVPYLVTEFKLNKDKSIVLSFEDISEEQEALHLKGLSCLVEEEIYSDFFQAAESYAYLMDFSVYDKENGFIGTVVDVLENSNGHDTLQLDFNGKEVLIPFVDRFILQIDEEKQEIKVDLPEGLLDLYLS